MLLLLIAHSDANAINRSYQKNAKKTIYKLKFIKIAESLEDEQKYGHITSLMLPDI